MRTVATEVHSQASSLLPPTLQSPAVATHPPHPDGSPGGTGPSGGSVGTCWAPGWSEQDREGSGVQVKSQ